jgi:predicted RND superfamily exporter protein
MNNRRRLFIIITFSLLAGLSVFYALQLKFAFSLDQFFPQGDPDLEFFQNFTKEFETDINFLLVGVEREEGVFEQKFLEDFHELTLKARDLPHVEEVQSLTKLSYPLKTPFGVTAVPAIHIDEPERYERDRERILADERFVGQFISEDATAMVMAIKTTGSVQLEDSEELVTKAKELVNGYDFEDVHFLGPAYFQKEMVAMQKREVSMSTVISGILVSLIMFFIFRKGWGIGVALISIGLGMLLFLGLLGATGRPLNAMAALYPVLMVIVGTSDVIHIMSKYVDELRKGLGRREAILIAIKEIGLATLLTSLTTAIGFATLLTSKIQPIRDFGLNAAIGVIVAYVTVIFFTTAVLSWFQKEQIIKLGRTQAFWEKLMQWFYDFTKNNPRKVVWGSLAVLGISFLGISMITTNYRIERNLPRGQKITEDFLFFEDEFSGFRPMELAVFAQGDFKADDYEVLQEMDKVENYLREQASVKAVTSATAIYKSIGQMYGNNRPENYEMPESESKFKKYKRLADKIPETNTGVLISKDGKKARISTRVLDVGADSIKALGADIDQWIAANTDPNIATFKRTGTGLILDKNSEYVRDSLLKGLGLAVLIVSLLMALLFRNIRLVVISLVPNVVPLLLAGAMLGFAGVELEAGISIVFAVVFGIAVDDTIHFLSKFKLSRDKGYSVDKSLHITFLETGKAICLTTVILFFGFLVMLFSIHPPSVIVGALISLTLFSALLGDLFIIPVMIRWLIPEGEEEEEEASLTPTPSVVN